MLKKLAGSLIFLLTAIITAASADQAAWIEKPDAYKAGEMINPGIVIREFCAPCGDETWKDIKVKQVEVRNTDARFYQIFINGEGIDLAYTYIQKADRWINLAMLLGLNVSGVPEFLSEQQKPGQEIGSALIDKILKECSDKAVRTTDVIICTDNASELWDARLNKIYNQLRAVLTPNQKNALKSAQLEWISYRDSEFELIDSILPSSQGQKHALAGAQRRMEIIRNRSLELEAYLNLIKN
ncbi:DUF1311 domain-containing protein [Desulfococcaceae bacterium HSG8]|nr:DUF1311 domain-containing protein [Desulfococcaceae bacterium HSG8]